MGSWTAGRGGRSAIDVVMDVASRGRPEHVVMTPVVLAMGVLGLVVAPD
jgi:hypothetical protein